MVHAHPFRRFQRATQLVEGDVGVLADQLDQKAMMRRQLAIARLWPAARRNKALPAPDPARQPVAAEINNRLAASRPLRPASIRR
jgi:hypothetical protein